MFKRYALVVSAALILGLAACSSLTPSPTPTRSPVTITVWDYYGPATPIQPLIQAFQAENPQITVKYEALDRNTLWEKLNQTLAGSAAPDVATVDLTWLPRFAARGALTDLQPLSGGKLNGVPFEKAYVPGAYEALFFHGPKAILYDFDADVLYYRADLFAQHGLQPPKTWEDLLNAARQLAEGNRHLYEFDADTAHTAQWIYENGGLLLDVENEGAVFNSARAAAAVEFYTHLLLKEKVAINWTSSQG